MQVWRNYGTNMGYPFRPAKFVIFFASFRNEANFQTNPPGHMFI